AGVNGLIAAELAAAGAQTAPRAFEGDAGFIRAFTRTIPDVGALRRRIGEDWSLRRVAFKPFPVCAFNQTPVTAALALHAEIAGRPIGRVVVRMNPYVIGYAGMASTGPFRSLSATLMSIPFCVALALQHGRCTLAMMGAFDDAAVLRLVGAVTLTPDPAIPVLSAVIEAVLQDGTTLVRDQVMTSDDYAYDRGTVATLVRRIGVEEGVPGPAYDGLEQFVDDLPGSRIEQAIAAFGMLPPACLTGDRPAP
ncbi:MAG: MmgE/PrpD family protein, partial [Gemmatimonadaceae bacterium]|nr:MmgE/PrpD family protein [Acetobacteraceae bacterium]